MAPKQRTRGGDRRRQGTYKPLPKQWVTNLRRPELKIHTDQFTGINSFGGPVTLVNSWSTVAQGVSSAERIGQKIQPAKLEMHVNVSLNAPLTGGRFFRILLFQWLEDDTALLPTVPDLLQDTATGAELVNSPYKRSIRRIYKVLYDNVFTLYNAAPVKRVIVSRGSGSMVPITYANDGTAASGVGQIYSAVMCDSAASPGDVTISLAAKLAYADS
jgi:hypothetical protein